MGLFRASQVVCVALFAAGGARAEHSVATGGADDPAVASLYREPGEELVRSVELLRAERIASLGNVVRVVAAGTARMTVVQAKLLPFPGRNPPADGMYEFAFTVVPAPDGRPDQPTAVKVAFDWFGVPANAVGIRVRTGANVLEARIEPGTTGFEPAVLVGRRLVVDTLPAPGEISPDQLPQPYVIVRAGEPDPADAAPGRLVIVVDADNVIRDAALR